ncbi:unnamed protein product, partial [Rotaria magnacalcarata]
MNVQLFDKNVRAILGTFFIYAISLAIHPYSIVWPTAIQYILIFFSPYIAAHSIFQQAMLHDLGKIDVALFHIIYRNVPIFFATLIIMICSSVFYWTLSWYLEKVFPEFTDYRSLTHIRLGASIGRRFFLLNDLQK